LHVDVGGGHIDERHGNVAVRQNGHRGRGLFAEIEAGDDLAVELVAGGIVSLADNEVDAMPDNDVTAVMRGRDLAVVLDAGVRGVDLRLGFPEPRGRGHGGLRKRIVRRSSATGVAPSAQRSCAARVAR
jgi:hypothetical protein